MFTVFDFLDSTLTINSLLKDSSPTLIGKIGSAELQMMHAFLYANHKKVSPQWGARLERDIDIVAGVFPRDEQSRIDFCNYFIECLPNADALAPWSDGLQDFEKKLIKSNNANCHLIDLCAIEPFYRGLPWSKHLKGKNVLVISCFEDSIKHQYKNKHKIWTNSDVLPHFNLLTIKHPPSKSISTSNPYGRWKDMVDSIFEKMDNIDYDVLLVGAGAASMPYANHAKKKGKQAVHLGGGLQILFGIRGARWDNMSKVNVFFNEHWIRPYKEEVPEKHKEAENGCYW